MKSIVTNDNYSLVKIESVRVIELKEWEEEMTENDPTVSELSRAIMKDTHIYGMCVSFTARLECES